LLNELGATGPARALLLEEVAVETDGRLLFKSTAVPSGDWLVRLQVNGAESPLERDGVTGAFAAPKVSLP
jgi:hypothetical protein